MSGSNGGEDAASVTTGGAAGGTAAGDLSDTGVFAFEPLIRRMAASRASSRFSGAASR